MIEDRPLSTIDLLNALGNEVKVLSYDQVKDYSSIDELLEPFGRVILLYFWKTRPKQGHWVCVFKTPRNTIEFFDSFGTLESQLRQIPKRFRMENGEDYPLLTELLYQCPYQVEYNDKKLQDDDSSVCGRYVLARLSTPNMKIEDFQKIFNRVPKANDQIVMQLTNNV
jgi:hypothetical protein